MSSNKEWLHSRLIPFFMKTKKILKDAKYVGHHHHRDHQKLNSFFSCFCFLCSIYGKQVPASSTIITWFAHMETVAGLHTVRKKGGVVGSPLAANVCSETGADIGTIKTPRLVHSVCVENGFNFSSLHFLKHSFFNQAFNMIWIGVCEALGYTILWLRSIFK